MPFLLLRPLCFLRGQGGARFFVSEQKGRFWGCGGKSVKKDESRV
jgi:hypothetical protein